MNKLSFTQFEKKFGRNWSCSCGSAFQADWLETVPSEKGEAAARYFCQICGREQIFSLALGTGQRLTPALEVPSKELTSDDVLYIRKEITAASPSKIRALAKKKEVARVSVTNVSRQKGI
jgi:hypothetical protein